MVRKIKRGAIVSSSYARIAQRLIDLGYSVIPIVPGEKRPGQFTRAEWRGMPDWQRFCERQPTSFEIDLWSGWPDAGICVALGRASNLIAVDFDYGPPELREALEALLPPSPVRKRGAKGYTAFYRFSTELPSRKWNVGQQSVIELLAHGRQTVLPPTQHPDGMEYSWLTTDTLENTSARELPELPADLVEQIERVVRPYQTDEDREPERKRVVGDQGDSYWREINDRAMADFSLWVPELFPMAKARRDGSYRVVAHWRNCERPNVSIHREGITDWGAGANHTPLDLVMAAAGSDLETATEWLRSRVGAPALIATDALKASLEARTATKAGPEVAEAPPAPSAAPEPAAERLSAGFFDLGGAMQMLYDRIIASSRRPQPVLAVGASIAAIGVLAGRRYQTPTGLRSNVYVVGIADSGAGKNSARNVIARAFTAAGLGGFLGGNKLASGSGLLSAVYRHPAILFQQDEFGMFLSSITDRKRAPKHLAEIIDHLTELYTSADAVFLGTEYADQKERPRRDIIEPCVCLHGTTTPGAFWSALQSGNAADGSLARFLLFSTEESYPDAQEIEASSAIPQDLIDALRTIAWPAGVERGNLSTLMQPGDIPPSHVETVPFSDEARAAMKALDEEITAKLRDLAGTPFTSVLARQWEHVARVAMIRAVSRNPITPGVVLEDVRWAEVVVQRSVDLLCDGIDRHVADNPEESRVKRTMEIIRAAGDAGISKSDLIRRTHFLGRDRDAILKSLVESGEVVSTIKPGVTKPTTIYRATA
jgi:hypothetical protein